MNKEHISLKQGSSLLALYVIGSSLVLGISLKSKQDAWISVLIAIAAVMPFIYIYARIMSRFPGKNLFEICIEVFGKVAGRIVIVLYVWYAVHLGSLVLRDFSEFIQVTAFLEMPQTVSLLSFIVLTIWAARGGPETLGRYASIALPVLLAVVALTVALLIKDMRLSNLMPLGENLHEVPRDAFIDFSFPFAESVLFLGVLNTLKPGDRPGRAWLYGILIAGATLLFGMYFRNSLVLGFPLLGDVIFPSYSATSVIIAGGFISRIEAVVGANLLIAGLVKTGVCLLVSAKGIATLLGEREYRPYVAPLGLLMVALASIIYKSTIEMYEFLPVYAYYAFPFQVALPLLLCAVAEIKMLVNKKREKPA